jgi:hypothetical protein
MPFQYWPHAHPRGKKTFETLDHAQEERKGHELSDDMIHPLFHGRVRACCFSYGR